jgi:hypothetical protein
MHQGGAARDPDMGTAARYERDWQAYRAMQRHRGEVDGLCARR